MAFALLVLMLWGALVAGRLWSAYGDARAGLAAMGDVRRSATADLPTFIGSIGGSTDNTPEELIPGQMATASKSFSSAHDEMDSPLLAPLRILPVIGRQVRSVSALTQAAATVASDAGTAFRELSDEAANKAATPEQRLASARRTQRVLTRLQSRMRALDLGPDQALVAPVARARNRFAEEYDRTLATLDRAVTSVTGVNRFLTGPTRYLVLAANNAEMRAGSGMYLQVGELTVANGRFTLGGFIPSPDLLLPQPGASVDPDIANLWGWLLPNQEWRNLNLSPRFDQSARMAAEMWAASGRGSVDGVIAIDVIGLQRLLGIVGPVDVADANGAVTTVTSDNIRQNLLLDQYLGYGATTDQRRTDERRERLGRVGTAVFESFNQRTFSAYRLLQTLQESGAGRNLLVWSNDPVEQAGWEALGASGILPSDAMLLSVLNRGGNKLDQFLGVDAAITSVTNGGVRRISVTVTMANRTPSGLPTYVAGPFPNTAATAGEYIGILALTVPKGSGNQTAGGGDLFLTGDDGPTRVLSAKVDLRAGAGATVTFTFDLPTSWTGIEVLASARTPEVRWTAGTATWTDSAPRSVPLAGLG